MTVMNGLGERDRWACHSCAKPSAPSNKDAGACPTSEGGRMCLCTVARGTLRVGGLLCGQTGSRKDTQRKSAIREEEAVKLWVWVLHKEGVLLSDRSLLCWHVHVRGGGGAIGQAKSLSLGTQSYTHRQHCWLFCQNSAFHLYGALSTTRQENEAKSKCLPAKSCTAAPHMFCRMSTWQILTKQ